MVCCLHTVHAQKVKGTRNITVSEREISSFDSIEISNNIEVFLSSGPEPLLEIEADDNLHESINVSVSQKLLRITSTQDIGSYKKYSVRITYTPELNLITAKGSVLITALDDMHLADLTVKLYDQSKMLANVRNDRFTLMANDKSKSEWNIIAPETILEFNNNAHAKALITANQLVAEFYNKANANLEGDIQKGKFRIDNSAEIVGKNLTTTIAEIQMDGQAQLSLEVTQKAVISAGGSSQLELHNEQKIEINQFKDRAVISKRNNKIK